MRPDPRHLAVEIEDLGVVHLSSSPRLFSATDRTDG